MQVLIFIFLIIFLVASFMMYYLLKNEVALEEVSNEILLKKFDQVLDAFPHMPTLSLINLENIIDELKKRKMLTKEMQNRVQKVKDDFLK